MDQETNQAYSTATRTYLHGALIIITKFFLCGVVKTEELSLAVLFDFSSIRERVSKFLTAHQHNYAIQCHSRLFTLQNTGQKNGQKIHKLNTTQRKSKQRKTQQNKTSVVQSPHMTLGQETIWAYSTTLPSPHGLQQHNCYSARQYYITLHRNF